MSTDASSSEAPAQPASKGPKGGRQVVLEVRRKEQVSPSLVRLVVGGPQIHDLAFNAHTDAYVKLLLPRKGSALVPPYDMEALRENSPKDLPKLRTYTVRWWDLDNDELALDIVIHGEQGREGVASDWAYNALPGDRVAMRGAGGAYTPRPGAEAYLFLGDHATVPAIAASLETLDANATGWALIQVPDAADRLLDLVAPSGVTVSWIVGTGQDLVAAAEDLAIDPELIERGGLDVFCHAERSVTKTLRRQLVSERAIARTDISISAYWAEGRVEDQFQAEKREAIGAIDPDEGPSAR